MSSLRQFSKFGFAKKTNRNDFTSPPRTPHHTNDRQPPTLPQHCATMTSSAVQAYPFLEPAKSSRGKWRVCEGQFVKGQPRLVLQIKNSVEGGWPPHILSYQHPACTLRACYFERRRKATHKLRCRVTNTKFEKDALWFAIPESYRRNWTDHNFSIGAVAPALKVILGNSPHLLGSITGNDDVLTQQEREQIASALENMKKGDDDERQGHAAPVQVDDDSESESESGGGGGDDDDDGVPGGGAGGVARGGDQPDSKKARKE